MSQAVPAPGGLPPMSIHPLGGIATPMPREMRNRDPIVGPESSQGHPWGR